MITLSSRTFPMKFGIFLWGRMFPIFTGTLYSLQHFPYRGKSRYSQRFANFRIVTNISMVTSTELSLKCDHLSKSHEYKIVIDFCIMNMEPEYLILALIQCKTL